jgi:hypothetical protein
MSNKQQQKYEGEVDNTGKPSGKGIMIDECGNSFWIQEGISLGGKFTGLCRKWMHYKETEEVVISYGQFEDYLMNGLGTFNSSLSGTFAG